MILPVLTSIVDGAHGTKIACAALAARKPMVVLALGQSNAGNHGSPPSRVPIEVVVGDECFVSADPLPGSTGNGGSIWSRLPAALRRAGSDRPVVIAAMGIDATSIDQWTAPTSPLRNLLQSRLRAMARAGLLPDVVLWQQGEADARANTTSEQYDDRLRELAGALAAGGSGAPIVLARSTVCRSGPHQAIRRAAFETVANDKRFRLGPDTDALRGERFRGDGCHLSGAGLDEAAEMWARSIVEMTSAASSHNSGVRPLR
jgi:hypothetical protein